MREHDPQAPVPDTDFRDRNAVEKYLDCGRFKPCAHLKSIQATLPPNGTVVYLPVCAENRFNKTGVATDIDMPIPGRPLGPITYSTLGVWAALISCPPDCRGYKVPSADGEHPTKKVKNMAACSQCGKPAVFEVNGHPICVDCNLKIQQAFQIRDNALKEQYNRLIDEAEFATGLYGVMPRYKTQPPVIHQGPMNFHSIKIDGSVVGAINTGNVKKMEVALNNIHSKNQNADLEEHLKKFTEEVLAEAKLSVEVKNDIVEQLSVLAAQLAAPPESRIKTVMKALVTSIGTNIAATELINHWTTIKHLLGF